jgi:hypothetical protein
MLVLIIASKRSDPSFDSRMQRGFVEVVKLVNNRWRHREIGSGRVEREE